MKTKGDQIINVYFPERRKAEKKKGIFATRREDEIFARRRLGGYINFYDLGAYADGTTVPYPYIAPWGTVKNDITLADYQLRDEIIFDIPVEDWKNEYMRISPQRALDYDMLLNVPGTNFQLGSDPRFTERGWKLPADWWETHPYLEQASPWNQTTEETIIGDDSGAGGFNLSQYVKVTTEPDPDAAAVTCPLSNNMRIYLMPGLKLARGLISGSGHGHVDDINQFFCIVPREPYMEDHELYGTEYDGGYGNQTLAASNWARMLDSLGWQKLLTGARARRDGLAYDVALYGTDLPASAPSFFAYTIYNIFEAPSIRIAGTLRTVIEIGGTFYYHWWMP